MSFNHIHSCFYFIILLYFCKVVFLRGSFFLAYAVSADERKSERAMKSAWTVENRREERRGEPVTIISNRNSISLLSGGYRPSDMGEDNHPHTQIRGGGGGLKKFWGEPFGPQFGLKVRGSPDPPPGPSPGSATAPYWKTVPRVKMSKRQKVRCDLVSNVMTDVHVWYRHLSLNCLSIAKTKRERIFWSWILKFIKRLEKIVVLRASSITDARED